MKSANLIIGTSHALRFAEAVGALIAGAEETSRGLVPIRAHSGTPTWLLFTTERPAFVEIGGDGDTARWRTPLLESLRAFDREGAKMIFAIGGNEHNSRFLAASPRPFDFHLAGSPAPDGSRQVIRTSDMREVVAQLLAQTFAVTRAIASQLPNAHKFYLAPPPPIPSEAHIRRHAEAFNFATAEVETADLRLKIYRLYVEIVGAFCEEAAIRFLAPPQEMQDDKGFLLEEYWSGSTHATRGYYSNLVAELEL